MHSELVIKLINGNVRHGTLSRKFDPTSDRIDFFCSAKQDNDILPLKEICYIKLLGDPESVETTGDNDFFESITTLTGDEFFLRLKKSGKRFPQGFFGYPAEPDSGFKAIFFTAAGFRKKVLDKPIGEVLKSQGLIDSKELAEALTDQRKLRNRKVGEIISEQTTVPQVMVDQAIDNANRRSPRNFHAKVGDILIEAGLVTRQQVDEALRDQSAGKRKRIGLILIEKGLITEDQLLEALAQKFGLKVVDLDETTINMEALSKVPQEMIENMQALPIDLQDKVLTVATSTPTDPTISENLRFATNLQIKLVCARATQIGEKIAALFDVGAGSVKDLIGELDEVDYQVDESPDMDMVTESDSKVIKLVNGILLDAHAKGVSDIHFEPGIGSHPLAVRYRRDGICSTVHQIAATFKNAVISRIKIIAKLDIAERRRPQSGKIQLRQGRERIEYRVEITPTIGGLEDAVLRVLSSASNFSVDEIDFSPVNLERFKQQLHKPYGIILCVGPTGSGKTTSLHAALAELNEPGTKIWTAEDPVEITQKGLRQVQVNAKIGFTFEEALRSFLRADPDVIMIGEMRDITTAKTAIGASLTGHRVFSTLHTNSAPETVVRLIEMGIDPFNFADAMLCILGQRLARRLCQACKEPYHPTRLEYNDLVEAYGAKLFKDDGLPDYTSDLTLMRKVGCRACDGQGYRGRVAIQELLVNSQEIRQAIKQKADVETITVIAVKQGMRTLRMDGIQKIFRGLTDLNQLNRVSV